MITKPEPPPPIVLSRLERFMIARHLGCDPTPIAGATPVAVIVGDSPAWGERADCPLVPYPLASAGGRLHSMSGIAIEIFLRRFARVNLIDTAAPGGWSKAERDAAAARAVSIAHFWRGHRIITLGGQPAAAMLAALGADVGLEELGQATLADGTWIARLPHPAGRSARVTEPARVKAARAIMRQAAAVDAAPCPGCGATLTEVEPITQLRCTCGRFLRRRFDMITGEPLNFEAAS